MQKAIRASDIFWKLLNNCGIIISFLLIILGVNIVTDYTNGKTVVYNVLLYYIQELRNALDEDGFPYDRFTEFSERIALSRDIEQFEKYYKYAIIVL